jgi:tetratricopeptide (TPR) repeat protein
MAIEISSMWDFGSPGLSEERFREALEGASSDDALVLKTQIARTYGLRKDFARAQQLLAEIQPQVDSASPEARVRYHLELGRTYSSATHPPESQTPEARELARAAYTQAFELARDARLDDLAIDALHMMTFVDTTPEAQLEWDRKAMAFMEAASQPAAKKWEGSLHNNTGYALHLLARYEEALAEFKLALAARQRLGKPGDIRVAHWMIAWTLRAMGRLDEALDIQLRLEKECDEAGEPDPYVFEELEHLYKALGNEEKAEHYAARQKAAGN